MRRTIQLTILTAIASILICSCGKDDDFPPGAEHDGTLLDEWVATDGTYVHDYYHFYEDGTGIHGSYESDIDWINEDDDITWYTENDEYIYINGRKCEYSCDGSVLHLTKNGRLKTYYPKD